MRVLILLTAGLLSLAPLCGQGAETGRVPPGGSNSGVPVAKPAQDKTPGQNQRKSKTKFPGRSQEKGKPGKVTPRRAKKQESARRRALTMIVQAFPRSRGLIAFLERTESAVVDQLLARAERFSRRREQAALRMAREQHPELAKLLQASKRRNPKAFASGMRALLADYDRIARARQLGEADHAAAIEEWRALSQSRLLGAQVTTANKDEMLPKIRTLLEQAQAARRRQLELQVKRHQEQIKRLQRRLKQDPKRVVDRQLRAIQKRINRSRRSGDASKRRRK